MVQPTSQFSTNGPCPRSQECCSAVSATQPPARQTGSWKHLLLPWSLRSVISGYRWVCWQNQHQVLLGSLGDAFFHQWMGMLFCFFPISSSESCSKDYQDQHLLHPHCSLVAEAALICQLLKVIWHQFLHLPNALDLFLQHLHFSKLAAWRIGP